MAWMPKIPTRTGQCASCPFLKGNDEEWLAICNKLRAVHGLRPGKKFDGAVARYEVMRDVSQCGDFACHHTVYDNQMQVRDEIEHRQCPGATAFHEAELAKKGGE